MTPALAGTVAVGALAGVVMWRLLRTRSYRRPDDTARRTGDPWWVLLAAPAVAIAWGCTLAPVLPIWPIAVAVAVVWVAAAETDLDVHRLPDAITLATGAAYLLALALALLVDAVTPHRVAVALGSCALLGGGAFILGLATGQIGLGDVKLLAGVGLILGSASELWVLCALLLASLIGLVAAGTAIARGASTSAQLAAGPGIILAATLTPPLAHFLPHL